MKFYLGNPFYFGSAVNAAPINKTRENTNFSYSDVKTAKSSLKLTLPEINSLVYHNSNIIKLLNEYNIPLNINYGELDNILNFHGKNTCITVKNIVSKLPYSYQSKVDYPALNEAAYYHDIGKIFIPLSILNKPDKLTPQEFLIIQKHSELGYELMKNSNMNKKALLLLKNHHQNVKRDGYPAVDKSFNPDINLQILSLADMYTALTEKRPYKDSLSKEQALSMIRSEVVAGKYSPIIFNALVASVENNVYLKNVSMQA